MTRVLETWLASSDHDKFAKAMQRCKHSGAFCASDGFCHYWGACFDHIPLAQIKMRPGWDDPVPQKVRNNLPWKVEWQRLTSN